jgi:hypothetical protein
MKTLLLLAGAAALASAGPAFAKPGKGHGPHGNHHVHGLNQGVGYGVGGCPPGLAKKAVPCVPPGQAKHLFNVGQRVPFGYNRFTPYGSIPYDLRSRHGLDPYGRYIYDNNYLYQVDPTTLIVSRILSAIL